MVIDMYGPNERRIVCARCGASVPYSEAYPTQNTQFRPKPKLRERRRFCRDCWHSFYNIQQNKGDRALWKEYIAKQDYERQHNTTQVG